MRVSLKLGEWCGTGSTMVLSVPLVPHIPDAVTESVERSPPVQKVDSLKPSRLKPITYQIDMCCNVPKDWLSQCKNNVSVWDITGLPVGQYYKVIMSEHCHNTMPILM